MSDNFDFYPDRRVWIEQPVLQTSVLAGYQNQLSAKLPGFVPDPPHQLHVTILHLGKPRSLHQELIAAGASIDYERFIRLLQPVLGSATQSVGSSVSIKMHDLAIFGPDEHPVLVARLTPTGHWLWQREPIMQALFEFLYYAGVKFPHSFIRKSPNLRHSLRDSFKPHVTLGSVPPDTVITGIDLPPVDLTLGPTRVRGV